MSFVLSLAYRLLVAVSWCYVGAFIVRTIHNIASKHRPQLARRVREYTTL